MNDDFAVLCFEFSTFDVHFIQTSLFAVIRYRLHSPRLMRPLADNFWFNPQMLFQLLLYYAWARSIAEPLFELWIVLTFLLSPTSLFQFPPPNLEFLFHLGSQVLLRVRCQGGRMREERQENESVVFGTQSTNGWHRQRSNMTFGIQRWRWMWQEERARRSGMPLLW